LSYASKINVRISNSTKAKGMYTQAFLCQVFCCAGGKTVQMKKIFCKNHNKNKKERH